MKKDQGHWPGLLMSLEQLRLITPAPVVLGSPKSRLPSAAEPSVVLTSPQVLVIGFVGGFIRHDNLVHSSPAQNLPLGCGCRNV
jgi:hypothetical protein